MQKELEKFRKRLWKREVLPKIILFCKKVLVFLLLWKTKFITEAKANLAGQAACVAKTHKIRSWLGRPCCSITSTFLATLWFGDSCGWMEEQMEKNKNKKRDRTEEWGEFERSRVGWKWRLSRAYVCTLPAGCCCSYGCCLFWCVPWLDGQKSPQTPPEWWDKTQRLLLKCLIIVLLKNTIFLEMTPDTPWGFGAGWYVPPSSESLVPLWEPKAASPPARCPSAAPSDSPAPPPEADSRRPDRGALAPAPPLGSGAALACVGCGRLHPGGGSSPRNLGREEQHAALFRKGL